MMYLFSKLFIWLLLTFIFGLVMGWFSHSGRLGKGE
ncbi:MAG: hypothetical protein RLZZ215_1548 [Pseudomonadota bacterium]|jgi:hypothetical protein